MTMSHMKKHDPKLPTARAIRRACSKELYRTIKRLKVWIDDEKIAAAEQIYVQKVAHHIIWIVENQQNKKAQANWWAQEVSAEIAQLWNVDQQALIAAFSHAYTGKQF
ncbi:dehydrogenase [Paenibacillus yanchengensis]|uniref:Dehydrogenase n=1 Tax=Paenibacillus yanchengensis TaxID=2035833 RepID=A0ABW4YIF6_9BACL